MKLEFLCESSVLSEHSESKDSWPAATYLLSVLNSAMRVEDLELVERSNVLSDPELVEGEPKGN